MTLYDIFFLLFSLAYLPYLVIKGKAHRDFTQRFGKLPGLFKEIGRSRPIWIHAVSVGEVLAVKDFVKKLCTKFPGRKIVLSTTTRTGNDVARRIISDDVAKFYFPLDFSFTVKRVVGIINPSALIIMETELWPNLILELSRRSVPVVLINGRISDRSFWGYKKIKFFFSKILKKINLFCMQTSGDAERIKALGVREENVKIAGNMKFDIETLADRVGRPTPSAYALEMKHEKFLIAGSTHKGEEEIVLDVYAKLAKEFQNLKLLIAPRHIDRAKIIKKLIERKGLKDIAVLDTFGELSQLYGLATIVFMGGSLVRKGGHNILEPAVFAKPVIFGPHMSNFRDIARSFLENKAAIKINNKKELYEAIKTLLKDENKRSVLGRNAKELIDKSRGATERNVRELEQFIT